MSTLALKQARDAVEADGGGGEKIHFPQYASHSSCQPKSHTDTVRVVGRGRCAADSFRVA